MNDPSKAPGYNFAGVRLLKASVELLDRAAEPGGLALRFDYSDSVRVEGTTVTLLQRLAVVAHPDKEASRELLRVQTELEGEFRGSDTVNIAPEEFGNNYAPPILFPFTREWIYRLTSDCAPYPPILLPPINVLQIRGAVEGAARSPR